jgi:hypothetical protein
MTPRDQVYRIIDGERYYQDCLGVGPDGRTDGRQKSVGDYLTLIRDYSVKADAAYTGAPGDTPALAVIRKIAGICVQAMEVHGAPFRETFPAAPPAKAKKPFTKKALPKKTQCEEPIHPAIDKIIYIGGTHHEDDALSMRLGNANTHPIPAERDARSAGRRNRFVIEARIVSVTELENDETGPGRHEQHGR